MTKPLPAASLAGADHHFAGDGGAMASRLDGPHALVARPTCDALDCLSCPGGRRAVKFRRPHAGVVLSIDRLSSGDASFCSSPFGTEQEQTGGRGRPSMVAARGVSGDLSAQLHGQQQRWHRRPERHYVKDGLPEVAGRGRDLDCAVLPVAAGRFWLRRFGLREHRSYVWDIGRLRTYAEDWQAKWRGYRV